MQPTRFAGRCSLLKARISLLDEYGKRREKETEHDCTNRIEATVMGYEEGFKRGYQDGKESKPATGKPPLGKALMRSRRYIDEYLLEYRLGYQRARQKRVDLER